MITQTLKLNLIPGQVLPRVNVSQYDAGTRTLQMLLYNGDQAFNISAGLGGFVQGTKPDRTGFQYAATVTEGSNVVTLVITQQMTAVSGEVTCELVIANGNDRIATVNFILYVEPAALADDTVISDTELPLIEEAAELAQRIDGIVADVEADADRAEAAADNAELWASRNPYIGQNGNWFVFDTTTETYVDTQIPATGPQGPQGDDGPTGPQGPTGPTGNGIQSITKTGTSGLVDTYTILFTNGTTTTFTVTNGQDGQGSGDMTKAVYDSTNAVADAGGIVAYVAAHSGAGTLAGLDDVTLSSLAAGDTLVYNATTQKWENSTVIQTLTSQVKDMNNVLGAKNIFPFTLKDLHENASSATWNGNVAVLNGVTWTFETNDAGYVTAYSANGTASGSSFGGSSVIKFCDRIRSPLLGKKIYDLISSNSYVLSGASKNNPYLMVSWYSGTSTWKADDVVHNSKELTPPNDADNCDFLLKVDAGATADNVKYNLMLCLKSVYDVDPSYQPYAKTNQQLTQDTTGLLDNTEVNGAVNMLDFTHASEVRKGYTFTNVDGVVQVTGSRASGETGNADHYKTITLPKGTYKVSGCPSGGSDNTWRLLVNINNGAKYAFDYGDGAVFTLTEESTLIVYCTIMANYSDTVNLTFKPMITVPSYNGDYVPYAKSNKELTELTVAKNQTVSANGLTFAFSKVGHVAMCTFMGSASADITANTNIATIPDGYRPVAYQTDTNTTNKLPSISDYMRMFLMPNGGIQAAGNIATGDPLRGCVTYPCE